MSRGGFLDLLGVLGPAPEDDTAEKVARDALCELRDAADMLAIHCPDGHFGKYVSGEADKLECRLRSLRRG